MDWQRGRRRGRGGQGPSILVNCDYVARAGSPGPCNKNIFHWIKFWQQLNFIPNDFRQLKPDELPWNKNLIKTQNENDEWDGTVGWTLESFHFICSRFSEWMVRLWLTTRMPKRRTCGNIRSIPIHCGLSFARCKTWWRLERTFRAAANFTGRLKHNPFVVGTD